MVKSSLRSSGKIRDFMSWQYFNNSQESFFISSHHSECFLTTSSKNTFDPGDAHPVYDVSC